MNTITEAQRQSALNQQQVNLNTPVANWTPLKHNDIRMRDVLKRCEDYRKVPSLDLDK